MPESQPLAILGGTFDPPHIGHLVLAECARVQFNARKVLFLPAGDPYKKTGSLAGATSRVSPAASRADMVQLAIAGNTAFELDRREVDRSGPTFTVDTLEELRAEGHGQLLLILGSDAVNDMPTWKSPERILELATIAVAPKPWQPGAEPLPTQSQFLTVDMPPLPISSTLIRNRVAAGLPIRYLVPEPVETYITANHLYRD